MKKSLIALAVAGVVAAPAFAATSNVDIYGTLRFSVDHTNSKAAASDAWTINDQTSRIGFKGAEDLGGGLSAVWQIEQGLKTGSVAGTATTTAFGGDDMRNTFIGLKGGFGTVLVGRHDTPYKLGGSADLFGDTSADSQKNTTGIIGRNNFDNRAANTIAYISPDFSGFHFAAAVIPGEEAGGTAANNDANGLMDSYSLVGVYANGPLKATLGYERFSGESQSTTVVTAADRDATKLNVSYKFGDATVGYTYERSDDTGVAATHRTDKAHLASLAYGMGPITLAAQYGKFQDANATATDLTRITLGAIYALSKRTNTYVAYDLENYGAGGTDAKILTMGVNHSF